jgi:hypothetical protein
MLAMPVEALIEALKLDVAAAYIARCIIRTIVDLNQSPANVYGGWAAETILSTWLRYERKIYETSHYLTADSPGVEAKGLAASRHSDSKEDLPSPSIFV